MDERASIDEVVRRFFGGADPFCPDDATGPLANLLRMSRSEASAARETQQRDVSIRALDVQHVRAGRAEVDFDAEGVLEAASARISRQRVVSRYSGPVVLELVDGEWKIADYRMEGRSMLEAFVPLEGQALEERGVRVRPVALVAFPKAAFLFFEVENATGAPVEFRRIAFEQSPGRYCAGGFSHAEIAVGEHSLVRAGWLTKMSPSRAAFRVVAEARERAEGRKLRYRFVVDPGAATALPEPSGRIRSAASLALRVGTAMSVVGISISLAVVYALSRETTTVLAVAAAGLGWGLLCPAAVAVKAGFRSAALTRNLVAGIGLVAGSVAVLVAGG